tara:strand:- start:2944 stop:4608 length:1665 start_codon:yes stop_codon:yes gene_type:complete
MKQNFFNLIKNPKLIFCKTLFYFSFYYSSVLFYLTLDIVQSPDFEKYYQYFEYYSGTIEKTNLEQGNLYFFLNYFLSFAISQFDSVLTLNELFNFSIHLTNSLIFLIGCKGLLNYLSKYQYSSTNSYLVLSIICFLPSSVELRTTLKPEILAYALIGWILYYLHVYTLEKSPRSALYLVTLSSILITSKASTAFIVGVVLILEIFLNYRKILSKSLLAPIILFLLFSSSLAFENYSHNGLHLNQTVHNKNYDNVVPIEFFTEFDSSDFINNPNRYFFYDSFTGIILFDTFNDFFNLYWNAEYTELNNSRKQFFKIEKKDTLLVPIGINFDKKNTVFTFSGKFDARWDDPNFIDELRMRSSFYFSSLFYFLLIILSIFKKDKRVGILSPYVGLLAVSLSSLGYFGTNNYDPLVSDTFKTFYFSFLIILSFSIVLSEILSKNVFRKILILTTSLLFLFYLGFPMDYDDQKEIDIIYKNSLLPTCNINAPVVNILLNVESQINCNTISNYKEVFYPTTVVKDIKIKVVNIPFINMFSLLLLFVLRVVQAKPFRKNRN